MIIKNNTGIENELDDIRDIFLNEDNSFEELEFKIKYDWEGKQYLNIQKPDFTPVIHLDNIQISKLDNDQYLIVFEQYKRKVFKSKDLRKFVSNNLGIICNVFWLSDNNNN